MLNRVNEKSSPELNSGLRSFLSTLRLSELLKSTSLQPGVLSFVITWVEHLLGAKNRGCSVWQVMESLARSLELGEMFNPLWQGLGQNWDWGLGGCGRLLPRGTLWSAKAQHWKQEQDLPRFGAGVRLRDRKGWSRKENSKYKSDCEDICQMPWDLWPVSNNPICLLGEQLRPGSSGSGNPWPNLFKVSIEKRCCLVVSTQN